MTIPLGRRHGIQRKFRAGTARERFAGITYFVDDVTTGVSWKCLVGGAYLVGVADENGGITGEGCAFIYPDL